MPIKKEIVFPLFLECCQFCDDIFWENIFEDLSYGKSPYGTYISKGFLCCNYKNKEFNYKIERKDPKIIFDEIYSLLTEKVGILSHKEKIKKQLDFYEIEKNIKQSRQEWDTIRRKNIKDVMYEKYVIEMKYKYSLSVKQCKYLLSVIFLSMMFKTITSKDIIFKDDKIQKIEGISFSEGKIFLKKPIFSQQSEVLETPDMETPETKSMSDNWNRFLKMLREK